MNTKHTAHTDLMLYLYRLGESPSSIEGIQFLAWLGDYGESPVCPPAEVLTLEEAKPYMQGWRFEKQEYGGAECYQVNIWTTDHVIYVHEYDGTTTLTSVPRYPNKER